VGFVMGKEAYLEAYSTEEKVKWVSAYLRTCGRMMSMALNDQIYSRKSDH